MDIFSQYPIGTILLYIQSHGFAYIFILLISQTSNSSSSGEKLFNSNQRLSKTFFENYDTVPYQTNHKSCSSHKELKIDPSIIEDEIINIKHHQLGKIDADRYIYTNQFVIESKEGPEHVKKLAHDNGFQYLGHVSTIR